MSVVVVATLIAAAIIWPRGVGHWLAEVMNAYDSYREEGKEDD